MTRDRATSRWSDATSPHVRVVDDESKAPIRIGYETRDREGDRHAFTIASNSRAIVIHRGAEAGIRASKSSGPRVAKPGNRRRQARREHRRCLRPHWRRPLLSSSTPRNFNHALLQVFTCAEACSRIFVLGAENLWLEYTPFGTVPPVRSQIDVLSFHATDAQTTVVQGSDDSLWEEHAPFGIVPPRRAIIDANVLEWWRDRFRVMT